MKKRLLIVALLFAIINLNAQVNLNEKLPIDPKIKVGKLANGLTYYIKKNGTPEKKVELRLVVNAGSLQEDDDQQGLAHFTEHMAFNGTTHFKKNELVSFLQSIGVEFGSDLNAYTTFNQTGYILPIPLSKPENYTKGMQVLQDWASGLSFDPKEIDAERKVVLEESRLGKGANDRMFRKGFPIQYAGSKYAERLPIGKDTIIKTFKYDAVKRFYKDWYRPNLMAVIAVGDINIEETEKMIIQNFGGLKNPANPRKRIQYSIPGKTKNEALVLTDPEATNSTVQFSYNPFESKPEIYLSDYKNGLTRRLFSTLLNQRLNELAQSANPAYVFGATGFGSEALGYDGFSGFAMASKKGVDTALQTLLIEINRVGQFGFTAAELERGKKQLLSGIERQYNNRDKSQSSQFADEYIRSFIEKEAIPGIENEFNYTKSLLPIITIEEVNQVFAILKKNEKLFITVQEPSKNLNQLPTVENLLAITNKSLYGSVIAYQEKELASTLLAIKPLAGKIKSEQVNEKLGITELEFSNGAKVVLKQTNFKEDEVLLSAFRKGGFSSYGLADKYNANYSSRIVQQMGFGNFSPVDLRKFLAGKQVSINTTISTITTNVIGNSTKNDVETMLQLVYLNLTSPRKDEGLYNGWRDKQKTSYQFLLSDPTTSFVDSLFNTIYGSQPMAPINIPRSEDFDKINLDRALAIYKELTSDATGFTFILTGNIHLETIKPLLETYIGGLPSKGKQGAFYDNGVRPVKGLKEVTVFKGSEAKSFIFNFYSGDVPYTEEAHLKTEVLLEILNIKVIEELREKIGGIYGGGFNGSLGKLPYENFNILLQLPCGPENVDKLKIAANEAIELIKKTGPDQKDLDKVKKTMIEKYKVNSKENRYWSNSLQSVYQGIASQEFILNYEQNVNAVTVDDIKKIAGIVFDMKNVVSGVLYPEKK